MLRNGTSNRNAMNAIILNEVLSLNAQESKLVFPSLCNRDPQ